MANAARTPIVLLGLWLVSSLVFAAVSMDQRLDALATGHDRAARNIFQNVSQRVGQHDAHLTSLSALANSTTPPPVDVMAQVVHNVQRFYPRIISVDLVSLGSANPSVILSTAKPGDVVPGNAVIIRDAALASTGNPVMRLIDGRPGVYLLVKRSPNSDAARYGLALSIHAGRLLNIEQTAQRDRSITLSLPDGRPILSSPAPAVAGFMGWRPPILRFEQTLASQSQPLNLRIERRPAVLELLSLPSVLWFAALLAAALFGTNIFIKQRAITRDAERRARLGEHEARIAHASRINSLGEIASGIAHELNQPLTAILSQSQAGVHLLNGEPINRDALQGVLGSTIQQSKRAGQILMRLRSWVKNDGAIAKGLNVNEVVEGICELIRADFKQRAIDLDLELHDAPPAVDADPVQIEQVVFNLVRNAADAVDAAGNGARRVRIKTAISDANAVIQITDSGAGIPPETLGRLFEPFHTTKEDGMGLGLSLSESIAERFGGSINITNADGGGAQATLTLPLSDPLSDPVTDPVTDNEPAREAS